MEQQRNRTAIYCRLSVDDGEDRETWDIVQKMVAVKKRPNKNGVSQIFAGLVRCPDCGRALSYNIGTYKDFEGSFVCNYAEQG